MQDADPNPFDIVFNIPASTAPDLNVPVAGFDPVTQTWQITLNSPLPAITHAISIDGFSQANNAISYRYSNELIGAVQNLTVEGAPTGGTFTLTTAAPLPVGTTSPIPYTATPQQVQNALAAIVGNGNVVRRFARCKHARDHVSRRLSLGEAIPNLVADASLLTGGSAPSVFIATATVGSLANPSLITSVPNTVAAINGNNAQVRVILDGSHTGGSTGLVLDASQSIIRGLAIEGFGIGISIPDPTDVGDLIQGNFIGPYLAYPVDQTTGAPLPSPEYGDSRRRGQHSGGHLAGLGQRDGGRVRSGRKQRDLRQRRAGRLARAGSFRQPGARQPDRRHRAVDQRALLPARQRRRRGVRSSRPAPRAIPRASSIRRAT